MEPAAHLSVLQVTDEEVRAIQRSRDWAHKQLMRAFPSSLGPEPRAKVGLLWALLPGQSALVVQSTHRPERPFVVGTPVTEVERTPVRVGDTLTLHLALACQKTPPSAVPAAMRTLVKDQRGKRPPRVEGEKVGRAYRSKPVIVPEEDRPGWFVARMVRSGLIVNDETMRIGPLDSASIAPGRGRIPFVNVDFEARVENSDLANRALIGGVGRGRTYGLGLAIPRTSEESTLYKPSPQPRSLD